MQLAAVSSAVKTISGFVAGQPFLPYKTKNSMTTLMDAHPIYRLFKLRPNAHMTAYSFIELLMSHALRWGNGYAYIEMGETGYPIGLWPLAPQSTWVHEDGGQIYYYTQLLGKTNPTQIILRSDEVLHIKNLGSDGYRGISPIRQHAEELGIQIAAQNYGAEFFGNSGVIQGYLKLPGAVKQEHKEEIKKSWKSLYSGSGNRHQTPVLSHGMEYQRIGIPPEEAQFLETRKYGDSKIAQIYNIPPHMIGDLSKSSFNNITEETINFTRRTLSPWFIQWEQEATYKLLSTKEQKTISMVFDRSNILRGTPKEEAEKDSTLVNTGVITRNEARKARNLNPIEGLDEILVPLNMAQTDDNGNLQTITESEPNEQNDTRADITPLFESFAKRMANATGKASSGWDGASYIDNQLGPICEAFGRSDITKSFKSDFELWHNQENCDRRAMTKEVILNTLRAYYGN
jgi:HK97 family phage portal protein